MMGRKGFWAFALINLTIFVFLIHNVWTLLSLLIVDGSSDAISRAELPGPTSELPKGKQVLIPRIIHQTYVNESIPLHWREAQQSCLDLHEDYEYKVRIRMRRMAFGAVLTIGYSCGPISYRANSLLQSMRSEIAPHKSYTNEF
jgi:hypothetical protein